MATNKISGVKTVSGGEYDELVMNGVVTCNGDVKAKTMNVDGVITINGKLVADETIILGGVVTTSELVRGKDIRADGVCTIKGNIEADHVLCKGVITSKGQISADLVEGRGVIAAKEIVGEKVILHCSTNRQHLFGSRDLSKVNLIEATEIDIDGIECETLNGHNITVGPNCIVKNVDCSGVLSIAPTAQVKNINGQPR